jgi:hypothetical protein
MQEFMLIMKDGRMEQSIACFRRVNIEDSSDYTPRLVFQDGAYEVLEFE